ncbi:MAG: RluA family pseudouridine synthase, partial [Clostridia bacterium]|nr:RluA family pseudouridine synthase [Clostridia bacterium]
MKKIVINKNDADQRLDKFMAKTFKTMPNALLYKYIRLKCVRINGVQVNDAGKVLY